VRWPDRDCRSDAGKPISQWRRADWRRWLTVAGHKLARAVSLLPRMPVCRIPRCAPAVPQAVRSRPGSYAAGRHKLLRPAPRVRRRPPRFAGRPRRRSRATAAGVRRGRRPRPLSLASIAGIGVCAPRIADYGHSSDPCRQARCPYHPLLGIAAVNRAQPAGASQPGPGPGACGRLWCLVCAAGAPVG